MFLRILLPTLFCAAVLVGCPQSTVEQYGTADLRSGFLMYGAVSLTILDAFGPQEKREDRLMSWGTAYRDTYQVKDDMVYTSNRFSGFSIIDLANPQLLSQIPTHGSPRTLCIENNIAYVLVSLLGNHRIEQGRLVYDACSRLDIMDVRDPSNAHLLGQISVSGNALAGALRNGFFYLAGPSYLVLDGKDGNPPSSAKHGWIHSIDVSDPAHPSLVDQADIPFRLQRINADQGAVFLVSEKSSDDSNSIVTYVDISDPSGAIERRGSTKLNGRVEDAADLDVWNGVLRVASHVNTNSERYPIITNIDLANTDTLPVLSQLDIPKHSADEAANVRFDGAHGYVVSCATPDVPLYVLDLSDPARPAIAAETAPARHWLNITPALDHLMAMNYLYSNGHWYTQAHWYSTANPYKPVLLDSVGVYTDGFQIKQDEGLEHIGNDIFTVRGRSPYTYLTASDTYDYLYDVMQVIQVKNDRFYHYGPLYAQEGKLFAYGEGVYSLAMWGLQSYSLGNSGAPTPVAQVDTSDMHIDVAELPSGWIAELYRINTDLTGRDFRGVRLVRADGSEAGSVEVNLAGAHRLIPYGQSVIVIGRFELAKVDCSNPQRPAVVGTIALHQYGYDTVPSAGYALTDRAGDTPGVSVEHLDKAVFLVGSRLVVRCGNLGAWNTVIGAGSVGQGFAVIDPTTMRILSTVGIGEGIGSLTASGDGLVLCTTRGVTTNRFKPYFECYARTISLDPVTVGPAKKVPGVVLQYNPEDDVLVMRSDQWRNGPSWDTILRSAKWDGEGKLTEVGRVAVPKNSTIISPTNGYIHYQYPNNKTYGIGAIRVLPSGDLVKLTGMVLPNYYSQLMTARGSRAYVMLVRGVGIYDWSTGQAKAVGAANCGGQPLAIRFGAQHVYAPLGRFGLAGIE